MSVAEDHPVPSVEPRDQGPEPTDADLVRINELFLRVGGSNVVWGAGKVLDVWLIEHRAKADREAAARMTSATWMLAISTVVLALATVALVIVTLLN